MTQGPARSQHINILLLTVLVLGVFAAVLALFMPVLGLAIGGLLFVLVAVILLFNRPWLAFGTYLFLLPPHVLFMANLLVIGLPVFAVRGVAAWKELVLLTLLSIALLRFLGYQRIHVALPDFIIVFYVGYVAVVALLSLPQASSPATWVYGLRDALLPFVIYAIGRTLLLPDTMARRVFRWIIVATLLFSVLGLLERTFVPLQVHVAVGVPRYYQEIQGIHFPEYLLGLPENYWTSANSGLLRRAVSVYGSSQPFALSFLFMLPVCLYGLSTRALPEQRLARLAFFVGLIALILTFTRFTIAICLGLLLIAGVIGSPRIRRIVAISLVSIVITATITVIASERVRDLTINTITFEDHSSSNRLKIWSDTLQVIAAQPFGYGMGTTGLTATRFGGGITSIEGQYSKVGVELGLIGLILYISVLVATSMYLLRAAFRIPALYQRGLCFALALTFIGLAANSMTTEWHNSIALVYPVWWLAGSCVAYALRQTFRPTQLEAKPKAFQSDNDSVDNAIATKPL